MVNHSAGQQNKKLILNDKFQNYHINSILNNQMNIHDTPIHVFNSQPPRFQKLSINLVNHSAGHGKNIYQWNTNAIPYQPSIFFPNNSIENKIPSDVSLNNNENQDSK